MTYSGGVCRGLPSLSLCDSWVQNLRNCVQLHDECLEYSLPPPPLLRGNPITALFSANTTLADISTALPLFVYLFERERESSTRFRIYFRRLCVLPACSLSSPVPSLSSCTQLVRYLNSNSEFPLDMARHLISGADKIKWIVVATCLRCSPRFLRKTRETLQKEYQEKLTKQQDEARKRSELEQRLKNKEEPIYDESPALIVRPGKRCKLPKVSVAIDATPATRTDSVLNQIPIELTKNEIEIIKTPIAPSTPGFIFFHFF